MTPHLLCVVTHPDDETMLTGGMLAMLAHHGVEIDILCATRGEGGEMGEPPLVAREALGRTRERELWCAAKALGAQTVRFLDYVDPVVGEDKTLYPYTDHLDEVTGYMVRAIERDRPSMVLTHGSNGEYGHPGHVMTHQAAVAAHRQLREQGNAPALYTFCAAIPGREDRIFNDDDPAHIVLDVTPWLKAKADAARCHRTQHGLFFRNHPEAETMEEVVRKQEALHRVWPEAGPEFEVFKPYRIVPNESEP
jgi:LmbE family N-acetylglucosaminyl deacetylase